MNYIPRHISSKLNQMLTQFKVVLVTGPRQVGKSTLLKQELKNFEYVTLDDMMELDLAKNNPSLFFKNHNLPLIIDEVQYAPNLFRQIKLIIDNNELKGQICITGSQTYELMQNVSESLAGRIGILELEGFSIRETLGIDYLKPFLPDADYIQERKEKIKSYDNVWNYIFRGSLPEMQNPKMDWNLFYSSYIKSYIERDVRNLMNIKDEALFYKFMVSLAARTGMLFNASDIANTLGVNLKTVQSWISILEASGLIFFLRPYENNLLKRAVKTPKIYFFDTGLVCNLVGWDSSKVAQNGAMSGELFETFVISEIVKSYLNSGMDKRNLYFYRDGNQKEIDLIIHKNGNLYPVEIKKSASPSIGMAKTFPVLKPITNMQIGTILCQSDKYMQIRENVQCVPIEYI